ncbi:hypothetical protein CDD83_5637 [Cordyceps sp. RAO-2017]|nr:hypothetical protein CDD83_5637 [Cordyceps sp. RAO-2017]
MPSVSIEAEPNGGQARNQRLLTEIIDHVAQTDPEAPWLEFPSSATDYAAGFTCITYRALANATNGLAWYLHDNIRAERPFQTIAYIGPNDARYAFILYACIKAGFKVLFSSPKNSVSTHLGLFSAVRCSTLVTTAPIPSTVEGLLLESQLPVVHLPSLEELLHGEFEPFPYSKTFEEAKHDPFVVLHTSGSTGNPKPMIYTHEFVTRNVNAFQLPSPPGFLSVADLLVGTRFISFLPLFHMAGWCFASINTIFNRSTVIIPSSSSPPTAETLHAILQHTRADWAAVSPSTVEGLGRKADLLLGVSEKMARIAFLGGHPSLAMGDRVSRKIKICNLIGSSECGGFAQFIPDREDDRELWPYVCIHPQTGPVFSLHPSGHHELIIKHETSYEPNQPVFERAPEQDKYRTSDLFTAHPTVPGFWQYRGRVDDLIVFLNGEKTNPIGFESHVMGHPDVSGALVFGTNRMEAGVLIELAWAGAGATPLPDRDAMVERLWPTIEEANARAPAHARIAETHICFVSAEKPMIRTGKGSVKRQMTLALYEEEIDGIYREAERPSGRLTESFVDLDDFDQVSEAIRQAFAKITKRQVPSDDTDFFTVGMDSLQVLRLARQLRALSGLAAFEPAEVYRNPSVSALTGRIRERVSAASNGEASAETARRQQDLHETLQELKYRIGDMDSLLSGSEPRQTVLLTGTTGYVGSYILDQLLAHPKSPRVICLNRSADGLHLQVSRNKQRDESLATDFPPDRVRFLAADLASGSNLGLCDVDFEELVRDVTLVIHNAWPVDFNLPLSAFKPALDGLLNLIWLCHRGRRSPAMLFISSISAAMNLQFQSIPERLVDSLEAPTSGYGESKFVAEHLLFEASQRLGFKAAVLRVGQVTGAAHSSGRWNSRDWLPRLIVSSRYLGAIPAHLGPLNEVDWIPIDSLASFVTDVSMMDAASRPAFDVYHAVNPRVTTWPELLPSIVHELEADRSGLGDKAGVACVSASEWVQLLRRSASDFDEHDDQIESRNPALKLLGFFEQTFQKEAKSKLGWITDASVNKSESLRRSESIRPEWMGRWVKGML